MLSLKADRILHATQRISLYVAISVAAVAGTFACLIGAVATGVGLIGW